MASTIFSELKQFSWYFTINCRPTSLLCVSTSEDEAKRSIINFVAKIDETYKDYRIAKEKQDWAKVKEFKESFNYNKIGANLNIRCFCTPSSHALMAKESFICFVYFILLKN